MVSTTSPDLPHMVPTFRDATRNLSLSSGRWVMVWVCPDDMTSLLPCASPSREVPDLFTQLSWTGLCTIMIKVEAGVFLRLDALPNANTDHSTAELSVFTETPSHPMNIYHHRILDSATIQWVSTAPTDKMNTWLAVNPGCTGTSK